MRYITLWLISMALLGLIGCTTEKSTANNTTQNDTTEVTVDETTNVDGTLDSDLIERGRTVYLANYCGQCHTLWTSDLDFK